MIPIFTTKSIKPKHKVISLARGCASIQWAEAECAREQWLALADSGDGGFEQVVVRLCVVVDTQNHQHGAGLLIDINSLAQVTTEP